MKSATIRDLTRVAMFTSLMCVLAYVFLHIPISPVAVSAQTFGVMLAGLVLKPNLAALSQGLYLLLGALGLPVFAGGSSGIGVLINGREDEPVGFNCRCYVNAIVVQRVKKPKKTSLHGTLASHRSSAESSPSSHRLVLLA